MSQRGLLAAGGDRQIHDFGEAGRLDRTDAIEGLGWHPTELIVGYYLSDYLDDQA